MARKNISTQWDRDNRNAINENFKELYNVRQLAIDEAIKNIKPDVVDELTSISELSKENNDILTDMFADNNIFDGNYEPWILYPITGGGMRVSRTLSGEEGSLAIIPVEPDTTYTAKSYNVDITDAFRIGLSNRPFEFSDFDIFNLDSNIVMGDTTVPEREYTFTTTSESQFAFIYVSKTGKEPRLKVEKGDTSTGIEPKINEKYLPGTIDDSVEKDKPVKTLRSQEMYDVPALESVNSPDSTHKIHEQDSASMYALYDALMSAYPTYITKELFATESTGKEIYKYTFGPEQPNIFRTDMETDLLQFFIISGVHGSEKAGWWCLYETMKQICENWRNSDVLEVFRWNVEFTVVPLVNVYGIDNSDDPVTFNGKINSNGVDINRNFPTGFTVGTPGDIGYGGSEPLTEPESIAIADYLNNNKVDFYADFHNFSSQSDQNIFMWNIVESQRELNMASYYFSHLSQKWKIADESFPQGNDIFFGHSSPGTGGSTPPFVNSLGITGGIFEISHTMHPKESDTQYSSEVVTLGTEAQLNWLYMGYQNLIN
ncbi:hypothetical protein GCM10007063_05500 [Lentibacillus kapialis]|uniref:Peptidase M14 domain-containing protein n=1 Tax=Lentibacillus kapialis TaxID=340214 RepID=A0A917UUF8_9BACI|nr:M14 family metallopeptidase [Lentibacillus kapialis]GGJ85927.1 hypothetical protein GCM10007063_05500 [Lentibacillus kapialis]